MFNTIKINGHGSHDISINDNHNLLQSNNPIEGCNGASLRQNSQALCQVDSKTFVS